MENKLIYHGKNNIMSDYIKTDDILKDMLMFMISIIGGFSVIIKEYVLKK